MENSGPVLLFWRSGRWSQKGIGIDGQIPEYGEDLLCQLIGVCVPGMTERDDQPGKSEGEKADECFCLGCRHVAGSVGRGFPDRLTKALLHGVQYQSFEEITFLGVPKLDDKSLIFKN